jgi:hypothetical protein
LADQKATGKQDKLPSEREREREREIQGKHSCNHTPPESLRKPSSSNNNSNNKPISFTLVLSFGFVPII